MAWRSCAEILRDDTHSVNFAAVPQHQQLPFRIWPGRHPQGIGLTVNVWVTRTARLERLLSLAMAYRGWTQSELARRLGRSPGRLVPQSGVPKLDVALSLAKTLDWRLDDVAGALLREEQTVNDCPLPAISGNATDLNEDARIAFFDGRPNDAVAHARNAWRAADDDETRAVACIREVCAHYRLGRFDEAMAAARRGLRLGDASTQRSDNLQTNLAIQHYARGDLVEARALSERLIANHRPGRIHDPIRLGSLAFAYYIRGLVLRRTALRDPSVRRVELDEARHDLGRAAAWCDVLARREGTTRYYAGIACHCRGAIASLDVVRGVRRFDDVDAEAMDHVSRLVDSPTDRDLREAVGWWCVYTVESAACVVTDVGRLHATTTRLLATVGEIAAELDDWNLRERALSLDVDRRQRFRDWTGTAPQRILDDEAARLVAGTMSRFPRFVPRGWQILDEAEISMPGVSGRAEA